MAAAEVVQGLRHVGGATCNISGKGLPLPAVGVLGLWLSVVRHIYFIRGLTEELQGHRPLGSGNTGNSTGISRRHLALISWVACVLALVSSKQAACLGVAARSSGALAACSLGLLQCRHVGQFVVVAPTDSNAGRMPCISIAQCDSYPSLDCCPVALLGSAAGSNCWFQNEGNA